MALGSFKIRGVPIKRPTTYKIERYNVTTMERLSNSDMVGDLLGKKVKLYFTYEAISAADLNTILDLIWEADGLFFDAEYPENGVNKLVTVYAGSIPTDLHWAGDNADTWVWKGVNFNLIQR